MVARSAKGTSMGSHCRPLASLRLSSAMDMPACTVTVKSSAAKFRMLESLAVESPMPGRVGRSP
jgi:hypothetical protein